MKSVGSTGLQTCDVEPIDSDLIGPGDMTVAHGKDERISDRELLDGLVGYQALYKAVC